jgi:hypothetical protein
MSPSESSNLSTTFARFIDMLRIPNYTANLILSDEGSALQADASRIGAEHFLCEMNAAVKRHRTLASRFVRVCNCLKERFDSACGLPHRQADETLKRLSRHESEKALECTRRCGRSEIYSGRIPMQTHDLPGAVPDTIVRAGFAAGRRYSAGIHDRTAGFPGSGRRT